MRLGLCAVTHKYMQKHRSLRKITMQAAEEAEAAANLLQKAEAALAEVASAEAAAAETGNSNTC